MFKILLKTKSTFKKLPKTITFAKISPKLLLPNLVTLSPLHFIFLLYLLITCTRPLKPIKAPDQLKPKNLEKNKKQ